LYQIPGIRPKRLSSEELKKELEDRGVEYENQNKRPKLIEVLDEELKHETLANTEGNVCLCNVFLIPNKQIKDKFTYTILGLRLRNPSMTYEKQEIR